jgi:8-oxo-dGTP diphosphatase
LGRYMSAGYHFKIRVGVVLLKNNQILLARQNKRPFWVLPGGTLEPGEGLSETAVRELQEEAALDTEVVQFLYCGDFVQAGPPIRQSLDVVFLSRYQSGTLTMTELENLDELKFVSLEEAKSLNIQPALISSKMLIDWESGRFKELLDTHGQKTGSISPVYLGQYS